MERSDVYRLIDGERVYQERRWPGHVHKPASYLTYMWRYYRRMEEIDSTAGMDTQEHLAGARDNMRKFAALAVASLQQNGIYCPRRGVMLTMPTAGSVYEVIEDEALNNVSSAPYSLREGHANAEFSEFLALIRTYLSCADRVLDDRYRLELTTVLAAIAVHCMQVHGAPKREGV